MKNQKDTNFSKLYLEVIKFGDSLEPWSKIILIRSTCF